MNAAYDEKGMPVNLVCLFFYSQMEVQVDFINAPKEQLNNKTWSLTYDKEGRLIAQMVNKISKEINDEYIKNYGVSFEHLPPEFKHFVLFFYEDVFGSIDYETPEEG